MKFVAAAGPLCAVANVTKVLLDAAIKVNVHALIDCLDAKSKVTPSCDCGVLFECPIVKGIQASESSAMTAIDHCQSGLQAPEVNYE
jgi:hypothetical protein